MAPATFVQGFFYFYLKKDQTVHTGLVILKYLLAMRLLISAPLIILLSCRTQIVPDTLKTKKAESTIIAFGSCFDQNRSYDILDEITAQNPALWIWLGDNIYADSRNIDSIRHRYNQLKQSAPYKGLNDVANIIGTWDDHDYGENDAGRDFPIKKESAVACLDFLDVPPNSSRRKHKGIYGSYIGEFDGTSIRFIMLDLRTFKDDTSKQNGTILGKQQWEWLESEITNSTSDYTILCSSLQVIPNEHKWESWNKYGKERTKLLSLLMHNQPEKILILSGDRHRAEISKYEKDGKELYEITSSSMNRPGSCTKETNSHRVGDVICGVENFGILKIEDSGNQVTIELRNSSGILRSFRWK